MAKTKERKAKANKVLHTIQPDAAGIDIGATEIYVAVPDERDPKPVQRFQTFTEDLHAAARWLKACGIKSVAMESTGVYWIPVFQILESYSLEVNLVNARHVKNVPGRKTDVRDCQWLQYLRSVGLLRGSFRPPQEVCCIRTLFRHRDNLIKMAASHVQHIQKALTQMNLHLHHVISSITGVTGLAIIDAILAGERDPQKLAALKDRRIKADKATIAKALVGDYHTEHLFTLKQSLQTYRHYQNLIADCDLEVEKRFAKFDSTVELEIPLQSRKKAKRNTPAGDLRTHLHRIIGTDLTRIDGVDEVTAHVFFSEIGNDLIKFPTAKHFASWLGLCPHNKISGGKVLSSKTRPGAGRLALALRMAAQGLHNSHSYLGEYLRRMKAKHGAPKAITATAHKLARIIYHLVTSGKSYDESVFAFQEEQYKERLERRIRKQAKSLGLQLVPLCEAN